VAVGSRARDSPLCSHGLRRHASLTRVSAAFTLVPSWQGTQRGGLFASFKNARPGSMLGAVGEASDARASASSASSSGGGSRVPPPSLHLFKAGGPTLQEGVELQPVKKTQSTGECPAAPLAAAAPSVCCKPLSTRPCRVLVPPL
jgi:hypothetical protein